MLGGQLTLERSRVGFRVLAAALRVYEGIAFTRSPPPDLSCEVGEIRVYRDDDIARKGTNGRNARAERGDARRIGRVLETRTGDRVQAVGVDDVQAAGAFARLP